MDYNQWEQAALNSGANFADQRWAYLSRLAQDAQAAGLPMPAVDISSVTSRFDPKVAGNQLFSLGGQFEGTAFGYNNGQRAAPLVDQSMTPNYRTFQGIPSQQETQSSYGSGNTSAATSPAQTVTPSNSAQGVNPFTAGSMFGQQANSTTPTTSGLGGPAPLTNAATVGLGMGISPFNTSFLDSVGQSLYNRANQNLTENVLPRIQQAGQAAGQYGGGSRQALAAGVAGRNLTQSVNDTLAPLYANSYENYLNRGVQTGSTALQGLLGLGQLDIGRMNAQTNAASAAAQAAGVPVYTNPLSALLGGALGGAQIGNLLGLWGN